jgi:hypothetical protein
MLHSTNDSAIMMVTRQRCGMPPLAATTAAACPLLETCPGPLPAPLEAPAGAPFCPAELLPAPSGCEPGIGLPPPPVGTACNPLVRRAGALGAQGARGPGSELARENCGRAGRSRGAATHDAGAADGFVPTQGPAAARGSAIAIGDSLPARAEI